MATLICRPEHILSYAATWSLVSGAGVDAEYPLTNLNDVRADKVCKLTGTSGKLRGTIVSTAIKGIAVINCNRPGASLTVTNNGSMASQTLAIPSTLPAGASSINGFKDLRAVTDAGTQWDVDIPVGTGNVAVGKILLISDLIEAPIRVEARLREIRAHRVQRTGYGVPLGGKKSVRHREMTVSCGREIFRDDWGLLRRSSSGPLEPFLIVLEEGGNDPMYVWFPSEDWSHLRKSPQNTEWTDVLEELNPGLAL